MLTRRFFIVTAIIVAVAWLVYALAGDALGRFVAGHLGHILASAGTSKVPDAANYVTARLCDGLWLVSLAWIGCALIGLIAPRLDKSTSRVTPWLAGLALFVALNIFCWLASQTALFWLVLRGTSVENQAQFHAKENFLREIKIHPRIALVGSSQSQAQFTEEIFNAEVGGKAWMMELHYPGSLASDVFFVGQRFGPEKIDEFVLYISFSNIYAKKRDASSARDLLRLRDLPESLSIGVWKYLNPITARYAALGMASPLFQYRASFQHALLGPSALESVVRNAPKENPNEVVNGYDFGPEADFQKMAFRKFIENSAAKHQRVIVIVGQMNPDYEARLPAVIEQDFQDFLKSCAATYPNLTLVWQNELLVQPASAYRDHAHVTDETAAKFTKAFAAWYLKNMLPKN